MNICYSDIMDKIPEPPKWFDENAVPRFCNFHPNKVANIYANEVVLVEIACQACQHKFLVAFSCTTYNEDKLSDMVKSFQETKDAGPSMNSETKSVVEFWKNNKDTNYEWVRDRSLETV
jgi:hypothetical protein